VHGPELANTRTAASSSAVTHEDPDRLAHLRQESCSKPGAEAEGRADEIPIFARGLESFASLAEQSRYAITESHTAVVSEQVLPWPRLSCSSSQ
jgi:hypothetical protein